MNRTSSSNFYTWFFVLFAMAISPVSLAMSFIWGRQEGPGFYSYSRDQIWEFLEEMGYPELYDWGTTRNSDGTQLRFYSENLKKAVILSCDGWKKELELPGDRAWMNDDLEIRAWTDDHNLVHFTNGDIKDFIMNYHLVDPSGNYFLDTLRWYRDKSTRLSTRIYSTHNPSIPLAEKRIGSLSRIFKTGDRITVVADEIGNRENDRLLVIVFEDKNGRLVEVSEKVVMRPDGSGPSPFYAVDMSPWKNEVVVTSIYDGFPYSDLYSVDLDSMEFKKVGKGTEGFYLKCDILRLFRTQLRDQE